MTWESLWSLALWLAGVGHFVVLIASFQVPKRLRWQEELARLSRFNRKLVWVYGAFTVLTIAAFGVLTLVLHDEFLRGDRSALGLAAFIGIYWWTRLLTDFFYYHNEDWPKGRLFAVGHVLLVSLFTALAGTYSGIFVWHLATP